MALTSKDIAIGSGHLYVVPYVSSTGIPADAVIETEDNRLGHIKEGAVLSYEASFYEVKDDLGLVGKIVLTEEKATLNAGVITWNADTLSKLLATGTVTTDSATGKQTLDVGGIANYTEKKYVVRFVHQDLKHRITLVGSNASGFELGYKKDSETSIGASFTAVPMEHTGDEGRLFKYEDTSMVTP